MIELSGWLPFLRISDAIVIPTYYLVISLAFCFGLLWLVRRVDATDLPRTTALDIALAVMIGGFLGARLLHVLVEAPDIYMRDPAQLYRVWEGGFVWYGGALLGVFCGWLVVKRKGWALGPWLDLFAPIGAAGYSAGRVACLLTGCCFGAVCVLPSGFSFRYPTQAFAVVWEAAVTILLLRIERRQKRWAWLQQPGGLFVLWTALHAIGRILMETFRADDRGFGIGPLSISMLISVILFLFSVGFGLRLQTKARAISRTGP